jgi:hypothetical protein
MSVEFAAIGPGQKRAEVAGITVGALLRAPVRLHGIHMGWPVDVIFDRQRRRALGVEVHCGDDERRFLPFAVASHAGDALVIPSSLVLLDPTELRFYTERGATFAALKGVSVEQAGRPLGALQDLQLDASGWITEVVVKTASGVVHVPFDDAVSLAPAVRAAS